MKIAVWYNLPSGGAKRALYYHVRGLVERGHHVEAWCPPMASQSYLPLDTLIKQHIVPMDRLWGPPKNLLERMAGKYAQNADVLRALNKHCEQCADEIAAQNFDILFANTTLLTACPPIGRFSNIPKALYLQEPLRGMYEASQADAEGRLSLPWIAGPPRRSWLSLQAIASARREMLELQAMRVSAREEVVSARAYDSILVNSIYSRETLYRTYGLTAKVCYLGLDSTLFVDRQRPREDYVIGLGSFQPGKNIELAIRAVAKTQPPHPRLMWVGNFVNEGFDQKMLALAQSLGVQFEPKVMVEDDELVELLNRAAMMVYAPHLEPFGFAPLEANLCGLPVVAVAEGGLRETIEDGVNGLLSEPDAQQMANTIDRLRGDSALYAGIRHSCRAHALEKWSLAASIDSLEARLTETIAMRG